MFQIQFHGDDFTSFYEQGPKEVLPMSMEEKPAQLQNTGVSLNIMTKMTSYNFTPGTFQSV